MLTGTVKTAADRRRATPPTADVNGVKRVYNDYQVANGDIEGTTSNLWIDAKLKTRLLSEEDERPINYRWHADNGVVYFIGVARSRKDLVRVIEVARDPEGVKKVVTHVRLR